MAYDPFGVSAQLACAGAIMCMFLGICVYIGGEIRAVMNGSETPYTLFNGRESEGQIKGIPMDSRSQHNEGSNV